jgi:UDP-N-acetylglucosamine 2-epimerase (non-hydrolysing)
VSAALALTVAVGTRPEVVKLAPVVAALRATGHRVRCVATGQHADPRLAAQLFTELGCPPDDVWRLDGDEGDRVGGLLSHAYRELAGHRPDAVVVLGDTYTAPLVAMAARRAGVGVVHVEAGLRSFNELSMEETNRRMLAVLATVHLAPTELARTFLLQEGVDPRRVRVVGNPVLDAVRLAGVGRVPLDRRTGVLVTAHRATNVDDPARLATLVSVVEGLARRHGPVLFPVHPRTRDRLEAAGWWAGLTAVPGVRLVDPLGYLDLLQALAASRLVVTDSGGVQEEASYLGVPVVVMRSTTPRWEGVENGAAVLSGLDEGRVLAAAAQYDDPLELARVAALRCPYGDGHAGDKVVAVLADPALRELLAPREPELLTGPPLRQPA